MRLDLLQERYRLRGFPEADYEAAAATIRALDDHVRAEGEGADCDTLAVPALDRFLRTLVADGKNSEKTFVGLLRYFYVVGRTDLYIRLTQYTGGQGVPEAILERLERVSGREARDRVAAGLVLPPLGTPPEELPAFVEDLMRRLREELSGVKLERVLSGNNHGIPDGAFAGEKAVFEVAATFAEYLEGYHRRQVAELSEHAASGKPWFEQRITPEVVDFVAAHPEIQGGVLVDGIVYETKIPYDIVAWLHAKTPLEKRYAACHCPFARERVKAGGTLDERWCHCSGGFVKRRYEVLFGVPLRARCVASVLAGDMYCRFAIDLRQVLVDRA